MYRLGFNFIKKEKYKQVQLKLESSRMIRIYNNNKLIMNKKLPIL